MKRPSVEDRLLSRIEKMSDGCWLWTGSIHTNGYGRIRVDLVVQYAHRVAYEKFVGPIPDGLEIDHLCRNHRCINPAHLEPVTRKENLLRGVHPLMVAHREGRCLRGHAMTPENTVLTRNGRGRSCRICKSAYSRERRKALREQARGGQCE